MRTRGPILTLLAVVGLALALLAVNMSTGGTEAASRAAADASASARAAQPAPAAPAAPPPSASAFPPEATYTGRTTGRKAGEATVAIAVREGKASAYLCDGKKLESWLEGRVDGSSVALTGKGGNQLSGTLDASTVAGTVSVDGASWRFSATPGKAPAGLYRARNANVDVGWIVRPDGSQTGVQNVGGERSAAPELDPAAGTAMVGGTAVPVRPVGGGDVAVAAR